MPGGKSGSTRSALGGRTGTNTILQNNSNNVSQCNAHSFKDFQIKLDVISGKIEKRFQEQRKQFEKALADMKQKVTELEEEVRELKDRVLEVEEYKQEITNLRNDHHKLQLNCLGVREPSTGRNRTNIKDIQKSIQTTVQTYHQGKYL